MKKLAIFSFLFCCISAVNYGQPTQNLKEWKKLSHLPDNSRRSAMAFSIGDLAYITCGRANSVSTSAYYKDSWSFNSITERWDSIPDFPGNNRSGGIAFVIDSIAYVGVGHDGTSLFSDMYSYNPLSNQWTQVASYPGLGKLLPFAAAYNGKGYVGGGVSGSVGNRTRHQDFWEYDPITNAWTQLANLPFGGRSNGVSYVMDSLVYMGFGLSNSGNANNDIWSYNPSDSTWVQQSITFPGVARVTPIAIQSSDGVIIGSGHRIGEIELGDYYKYDKINQSWSKILAPRDSARTFASSFTINNQLYIFGGQNDQNQTLNDLWAYKGVDPCERETWLGFPSLPDSGRRASMSFSLGDKGYVVCGRDTTVPVSAYFDDFWQFDAHIGTWTQLADFPGGPRSGGIAFVIDSIAFVGLGHDGTNQFSDIYRYSLASNQWTQIASYPGLGKILPFVASYNGKAYIGGGVSGGFGTRTRNQDFWEYNPITDTWTQLANLPFGGRSNGVSYVMDSLIYMGLGLSPSGNANNDIWFYNPATTQWNQQIETFPGHLRHSSVVLEFKDEIVIGGGQRVGGVELGDYYIYKKDNQAWNKISAPADSLRTYAMSFTINDQAYLFGGQNNLDLPLNDLWRLSTKGNYSKQTVQVCDSFVWANNSITYFSSGVYFDNHTNSFGCDSIIVLELNIPSLDLSTTLNVDTLQVQEANASYQWIDCNNGYSIIPGATNQYFKPSISGNYACEVTNQGCIDTTACFNVIITNTIENKQQEITFHVFPNPASDVINIELNNTTDLEYRLQIFNSQGRVVSDFILDGSSAMVNTDDLARGMYFVRIVDEESSQLQGLKKIILN